MIRISKKGDYAVFIMGFLAQRGAFPSPTESGPEGTVLCSAQEISASTQLQKSIVANLLKDLTRAGLLESVRGIRGGYRLACDPEAISLGQILRVVEGPFTLVDCTHDHEARGSTERSSLLPLATPDPACRLEGHCPSRSPMRVLHERIQRLIDEIRLPELCGLRRASPTCTTSHFAKP